MIHFIRTSRFSKIVASYLALQLVVMTVQPSNMFALTGGPAQPEFNSFTPIGTSDMVNLSSGDFNYNIPIMDVGGYPLNLAYDSGITMDQEASWVGLGWNLNVGQITRNVRGIPDDFKGDEITYENNIRDDVSVGVNIDFRGAFFGGDLIDLGIGLGVQHNNYNGITFNTSFGPSFALSKRVNVGMQLGTTSGGGASISPSVSITSKGKKRKDNFVESFTGNFGIGYDSQKGLSAFNVSMSKNLSSKAFFNKKTDEVVLGGFNGSASRGLGTSVTLNDYLTFTPKNDLRFRTENLSLSIVLPFGGAEAFGGEAQFQTTGWGSIQRLEDDDKHKILPAFGYEHTESSIAGISILDFNREKDQTLTENSKTLGIPNYTYDTYNVMGQGQLGSFRPYRNQVGNVYNNRMTSTGLGGSFGAEFTTGAYFHGGGDIEVNPSSSETGRWEDVNNTVLNTFELDKDGSDQAPDYEAVYYKMSGDFSSDAEYGDSNYQFYDDRPMMVDIGGAKFKRKTRDRYKVKNLNTNNNTSYSNAPIQAIQRQAREDRSNVIQKITNAEAIKEPLVTHRTESFVKGHHTAGIIAQKPDGSRYVYGQTAYNLRKIETTFSVSGNTADCSKGIVGYDIADNTISNAKGRDHFFNNVTTPAYAHSYPLTAVLSKDYQDLTNDGLTPDDLGAYTKINYELIPMYRWRTPSSETVKRNDRTASLNNGLYTDKQDQKANYIYGEKELKYVTSIETKTHIAIFELSDRKDGLGVLGQDGGVDENKRMRKLDKIQLYALTDYMENGVNARPLKTVHFEYDYELCQDIRTNLGEVATGNELANQGGKLTLKKVFFTYQDSFMGAYTPYEFNYSEVNPDYNLKGYDIWGCYKENIALGSCNVTSGALTNTEFPFVEQDKTTIDQNVRAWILESIDLPSGGKLTIEQESDDYRYVQDRKAMQMFTLVGAGDASTPTSLNELEADRLFVGNDFKKYLYVALPDHLPENYTNTDFRNDFIKDTQGVNGDIGYSDNNLMYFRVLTNMTDNTSSQDYDYVTGYVGLDGDTSVFIIDGNTYAALPLKFQDKEGGVFGSNEQVNPISKSGWYFARRFLNRQAYGLPASDDIGGFEGAAAALVSSLASVATIFGGPNQVLKSKAIASTIIPEKSWIRLYEPSGFKYGGGCRVKRITLEDQWDVMTGNTGQAIYKNRYGQEYSYLDDQGKSSGVATFEPNGSKENPFVLPIFDDPVKLIAPEGQNYTEKPLGESFFPVAQVTYSQVRVKNLSKDIPNPNPDEAPLRTLSKHATGEVTTQFYTSRDFPTIADHTEPILHPDNSGILGGILKLRTRNHLTMSQGYVVHTNDMNGKMKRQRVRAEGQNDGEFISGVDYNYMTDTNGKLTNLVDIIQADGTVEKQLLGVNYDMINDFRKSDSDSQVVGADGNLAVIPSPLFGIPLPVVTIFPNLKIHETQLKTSATTKVIHTHGLLKEKIAYDLGARVSTENLAWDGQTGDVLLTKTDSEYGDHYYNFTYPARWAYPRMQSANDNLGLMGNIQQHNEEEHRIYHPFNGTPLNPSDYLNLGDEITVTGQLDRFWVVSINGQDIKLLDRDGNWSTIPNGDFKIIRSGNENTVMASMASATTRALPFNTDSQGNLQSFILPGEWLEKQVINASAVEYSDFWDSQCEYELPAENLITYDDQGNLVAFANEEERYNPYIYNVRGEHRAVKSYAYLSGRNNGQQGNHPRNEGFFQEYAPFYQVNGGQWGGYPEGWTFASEVTKYSPYGAELENKDALERFSAAQYDHSAQFPTAVASNAQYQEIGFDNFEFSESITALPQDHFSFKEAIDNTPTASISDALAHTGKRSVLVNAGTDLDYELNPNCEEPVCDIEAIDDIYACINSEPYVDIYILQNDLLDTGCGVLRITTTGASYGSVGSANYGEGEPWVDPSNQNQVDNVYIRYTVGQINNDQFTYTIHYFDPASPASTIAQSTATVNVIFCE